ncbi:Uncharacterized protein OS=Sorangium cellulosum (strain So ce56) GN=sce5710 PE=4 SV=1 [Gemmataceae bacterium]|nr:Uncharacterized protein OS=Sorangium cellulosum (strain So ce56) GN=sce5710 PE=4 SV=1 [Gemmataceae bacterium]VTT96443.1 Uncharacterized protein OS=Sorangium cellulosum (strain So ce56) GN=sce5710 PE=4 SV=1 [Gemmataceae bacterium]
MAEGKSSETDLLAVTVRVSPIVVSAAQLAASAACYAAGPVDRTLGWGLGDEPLTLFSAHDAARLAARARASGSSGPAPAGHTRKTGAWHAAWTKAYDEARATQAQIVRDIFPPPEYAPQFDPAWRTSTVVALCRQMDESGDFSIVPILADALEDAGCDDVTLLQCCRVPGGVHVRGNWAVDLVLGRG